MSKSVALMILLPGFRKRTACKRPSVCARIFIRKVVSATNNLGYEFVIVTHL